MHPRNSCSRPKTGIRAIVVVAFPAMTLSTTALAQKPMCHAMGTRDLVPPDKLPAPEKISGVGNVHLKITATPEAQTWFDQGLNLYHDFWDYESAKAFEQAIRVDPKCAMCWWGLAGAENMRGDDASGVYGKKALAEAMRLKDHASGTDKLYIEAADASERAKEGDRSEEVAILRKLVKK